jgi:YegS/Rv2252/BmrU family lipid kinase
MDLSNEKILFVVNPKSGGNDKSQLINSLENFININKLSHQIFYTTEENNLEKLKFEIIRFQAGIIVAVGGDGTCNLVAQTIVNTDKLMGILPLGSANGLATELGIPKNLNDALQLLITGKVKTIDTILINNMLCLHIRDIGLNARVIKRFEEDQIRGIYGYTKHFFKELWGSRPFKVDLITGGKKTKKKAHVVAIANASRYGTGVIINPNGKMDDGEFEVVIVKPYPFFGLFSLAAAIFMGYLDKIKYAEIKNCKSVLLFKNKKQLLHIDGEIIEEAEKIEAKINPTSLKVIVPRD